MRRTLALGALAIGCVFSVATSKDPGFDTGVTATAVFDSGMEVRGEPVYLTELELEDRLRVTSDRDGLGFGELVVRIDGVVERPEPDGVIQAFLVDADGNEHADVAIEASASAELALTAMPCQWDEGQDLCEVELHLELRELDGAPVEVAYAVFDLEAWGDEPGMITTVEVLD